MHTRLLAPSPSEISRIVALRRRIFGPVLHVLLAAERARRRDRTDQCPGLRPHARPADPHRQPRRTPRQPSPASATSAINPQHRRRRGRRAARWRRRPLGHRPQAGGPHHHRRFVAEPQLIDAPAPPLRLDGARQGAVMAADDGRPRHCRAHRAAASRAGRWAPQLRHHCGASVMPPLIALRSGAVHGPTLPTPPAGHRRFRPSPLLGLC